MARAKSTHPTTRIPDSPLESEAHPQPPASEAPRIARYTPDVQVPPLNTSKPNPTTEFPLILLEGDKGAGKSWECARFTGDERVGRSFYLEWGIEGTAQEYLAVPGADYEIVNHDGTWGDILGQVRAVRAEAVRAHRAGQKPVVLIIDTITGEWEQLKTWTNLRTRSSARAQAILAHDPDAAIPTSFGMWQETKDRHRALMRELATFPGIVVLCARGREVAETTPDGTPTGGQTYRIEGEKDLEHDAKVVVRMRNGAPPMITKCRSVHAGINPVNDAPRALPGFSLEWLVFDVLGISASSIPRTVRPIDRDGTGAEEAAEPPPWETQGDCPVFDPRSATQQQWHQAVQSAESSQDLDYLGWLWKQARAHRLDQDIQNLIETSGQRVKTQVSTPAGPDDQQGTESQEPDPQHAD